MPLPELLDHKAAYAMLCLKGAYIPKASRRIVRLAGMTYTHTMRGVQPVVADINLLSCARQLYVEGAMREPLEAHQLDTVATSEVAPMIEEYYSRGLVWGFAGFATAGFPYAAEARAMRGLLDGLKSMRLLPSLISDGGVSDGALGLSGVLAARSHLPSLGFIPRQVWRRLGSVPIWLCECTPTRGVNNSSVPRRMCLCALAVVTVPCVSARARSVTEVPSFC